MREKRDLPTGRWMEFFKELGSLGVPRVILSGGEVFTRPDLLILIDGVIINRMRYSLISNGTLITDDVISSLMEGKRRIRLDYIQVSIDGSCAAIHDLSRPPKSFDHALRGLRLLVEAKFPATVRVTLNHYNINDLDNIARLLIDDVGLQSFSTNEVAVMGSARCYGENVSLSNDERRWAMKKLTELNEQYGGKIEAAAGPLALAPRGERYRTTSFTWGDRNTRTRDALLVWERFWQDGSAPRRIDGTMQHAPDTSHGGYRNAFPPRCMAQLSGDQCCSPPS